jgi:hypothetical protein
VDVPDIATSSSVSSLKWITGGGEDAGADFIVGLVDVGRLRFFETTSSSESGDKVVDIYSLVSRHVSCKCQVHVHTIFEHGLLCGRVQAKLIVRIVLHGDPLTLYSSASRVVGYRSQHIVLVFIVVGFGVVDTFSSLHNNVS